MTDLTKHGTSKARTSLSLLCAVNLFVSGIAFADDMAFADDTGLDAGAGIDDRAVLEISSATGVGEFSEASRLQVGMPIERAIELLGGNPDSETEIGAACGMLDVLTWDDNGTKIISVDGTVTSIVEGGNAAR